MDTVKTELVIHWNNLLWTTQSLVQGQNHNHFVLVATASFVAYTRVFAIVKTRLNFIVFKQLLKTL